MGRYPKPARWWQTWSLRINRLRDSSDGWPSRRNGTRWRIHLAGKGDIPGLFISPQIWQFPSACGLIRRLAPLELRSDDACHRCAELIWETRLLIMRNELCGCELERKALFTLHPNMQTIWS